jgi:hypothetical protein
MALYQGQRCENVNEAEVVGLCSNPFWAAELG